MNPLNIGYVRVSTDRQDLSVEAQTEAVKREAAHQQFDDLVLFAEPDTSGSTPFMERAEGARLLHMVEAAHAAGQSINIIVPKVDRLGRNVIDIDSTVTTLQKWGARLILLDINVDTRTAMGRAFLQIAAVFAQLELTRIRERIQTVLNHKREGNELCGSLSYGWNVWYTFHDGHQILRTDSPLTRKEREAEELTHGSVTTQIEANLVEQKWIKHMAGRFAVGWSYNAIALELNRLDVATKRSGEPLRLRGSNVAGEKSMVKLTRSKWQFGQVAKILQSKTVIEWLKGQSNQQAAA